MVSEEKKKKVKELRELIEKHSLIGVLNFMNMPATPLQNIRKRLRGKAIIKMWKKSLIKIAMEESKKKDIKKLLEFIEEQPALVFSNMDSFELYKILTQEKMPVYAREGDVAPKDIIIRAGPTTLAAGPAIGELQKFKIPVMVKDGKIHVREDKKILKKGETISRELAALLKKLGIQTMEVGLNLTVAYDNGTIFTKDVLVVDEFVYISDLQKAFMYAINLSVEIGYPTKDNIRILLRKAFNNAKTLGINAQVIDSGVIVDLVKKATIQSNILKNKLRF